MRLMRVFILKTTYNQTNNKCFRDVPDTFFPDSSPPDTGQGPVVRKVDSAIHRVVSTLVKMPKSCKSTDIELIINKTKLQLKNA